MNEDFYLIFTPKLQGSVQQDQYAMEGITDGKDRYALMFEDFIVRLVHLHRFRLSYFVL